MREDILIGADPELFVKRDGKYVSAYGMVPGTKAQPHPVRSGGVQVDGMALEITTNPAATEEEFIYNVSDVLSQLRAMVPGFEVEAVPVVEFGEEYMRQQPFEATELGCSPDYNAWSGRENVKPNEASTFRTGAGHIHVGWTKGAKRRDIEHMSMAKAVAKQLDFYLALPSLIYDADVKRREMYGKAGAFRPKPYGVEYRTLSNRWLVSRELISLVYKNTKQAFNDLMSGKVLFQKYGDIQKIINSSDTRQALYIMDRESIQYEI